MQNVTKREFLNLCGVGGALFLATKLHEFLPLPSQRGRMLKIKLSGKLTWLEELPLPDPNVAFAQSYYGYQYQNPYSYYGQYQMWAQGQWYQAQYQAYMLRLAQQYAWAQQYAPPMGNYMQQYANSYSLSQPFPMDSIQSLYSYGRGQSGNIVLGLNHEGDRVRVSGKNVPLMSAVSYIADQEGYSQEDKQAASGPQSNARPMTASVDGDSLPGSGYETTNGSDFVSTREFRDQDSGKRGSIVMFDTGTKKESRLIAV